jgi:hypothetical protein
MKKLIGGLGGAIGSRYLKNKNQLVFTEYAGFISTYNLVQPLAVIVSQGTATITGTWHFDCETGTMTTPGTTLDFWWEQMTAVQRQIVPQGGALAINLGIVDFASITPAAMQTYAYTANPINGNNDSSNKLVNGAVFCVKTREGNYCKLKVVTYGYNLTVQYITYKLQSAYTRIGSGYSQPEDVAMRSDEATAYVTERTGNLLKVSLGAANRASAAVVCSGLNTPQQLWLDEVHNQAYTVEYSSIGRLIRVDLTTGTKTVIYTGLNLPIGLVVSSDLDYAYVSEQGTSSISRIDLSTATKMTVATGLTNPFFLTWNDSTETRLLVAERDPANRVSIVDITKTSGNVNILLTGTGVRPSSVAVTAPGTYEVFCDAELDEFTVSISSGFLYKGIGYVPWNLIPASGKADTTTQPAYPYQFPKDSPFGGTLPVNIDHINAWNTDVRYYKVLIDGNPRFDSWSDLRMNPANGKYEISEVQKPDVNGFYPIHNAAFVYYNTDLGCLLNSTSLSDGLHSLTVQFFNAAHVQVSSMGNALMVNNEMCVASMDIPTLDSVAANPACGYLKYTATTGQVKLHWSASHPKGFATYSFGVVKGVNSIFGLNGPLVPPATSFTYDYIKTVAQMLDTCPTVAAFYEALSVYTTVINGVGRQAQYDAYASVAFCLAP